MARFSYIGVPRRVVRDIIETTILSLFIFVCLHFSVQNYQVVGDSMFPSLEAGNCVLANKLTYKHIDKQKYPQLWANNNSGLIYPFDSPRTGDVVVFRYPRDPSRHFVKRIIGTPGDQVQMQKGSNKIYVNGKELDGKYISSVPFKSNYDSGLIGEGGYYVLGDNRAVSNDSRAWGLISHNDIIGKYWFRYWEGLCALAPLRHGNLR